MNIHYLMQHISYSLHTIVRNYGEDQKLQESFCGRPDFTDNRFFELILILRTAVLGELIWSKGCSLGLLRQCRFCCPSVINWYMPGSRFPVIILSLAR
ncbi:MAG: hypothetical protein ACLRMZ_20365 [Blautia marasmi]